MLSLIKLVLSTVSVILTPASLETWVQNIEAGHQLIYIIKAHCSTRNVHFPALFQIFQIFYWTESLLSIYIQCNTIKHVSENET
ncbi:uncharacterized protein C8R40DRAFT_880343 [Lentinula edodes]|uniref:uncharacterized protein n=1 Tax=Lentinula edodes TaxID=5353 RepID=UPI001E8CE3CE|nr:uncharacterized protein C8R40DRAFT_880343 [Lentinula edodes]KAH7878000.1 hypothetical protein C8R40DRAFT_880343 [Lentinula edodes]